ncbi:hypothetical protein [Dethiobacter alkaliphilus]|nr:hypothetical protein [Dethiobacter alkaliphilus]
MAPLQPHPGKNICKSRVPKQAVTVVSCVDQDEGIHHTPGRERLTHYC